MKLRDKLYFSLSILTPCFPHLYYMLGANLGLLLYGEVSVMYLLIVWRFYFLIKLEILFTNFARAEFECVFSFISPLFIALL